MARKTRSQSVDQVPLPFDDLFEPEACTENGQDSAGATPARLRKKLREKRSGPGLDTQPPGQNEAAGAIVSETSMLYASVVVSGTVTWEGVEACACEVLPVWNDGSELEWAESAWMILAGAHLTSYSHAVEYHQVILRFFALCSLYLDFSRIAWDRGRDMPYAEWAAHFQLSELRIGQLLGLEIRWEEGSAGNSLLERALHFLTAAEQPWVLKVIRRSFGGASALCDSLWATQRPKTGMMPASNRAERSATGHPNPIRASVQRNDDEEDDVSMFEAEFQDEPDANFAEMDVVEDDYSAEKQRALEWLHTGRL